MSRPTLLAALVLAALLAPAALRAQGPSWRPPSRQMPAMPPLAELKGDWLSSRAAWFAEVESLSGVAPSGLTATGEPHGRSGPAQMVRFTSGPLPAVVWTDRNTDGKADMIEIYKSGGMIIQLIDADFDGEANVMRVYDASGKLVRQDRM